MLVVFELSAALEACFGVSASLTTTVAVLTMKASLETTLKDVFAVNVTPAGSL